MVVHVTTIADLPVVAPDSSTLAPDPTTVHDLVGWAGFLVSELSQRQAFTALIDAADADAALLRDALGLGRRMRLMGETSDTAVELLRLAAHEAAARAGRGARRNLEIAG